MGEEEAAAASSTNWSTKLEDLIDDEDYEGAKKLLEGIIGDLENRSNASTNLTLAAALTDLASLYQREGLSIKADSCSTSAFLIKKNAESLSQKPQSRIEVSSSVESEHSRCREELATVDSHRGAEESFNSGSNLEEEWETALSEGLLKLDGLSPATKSSSQSTQEKSPHKQRGRGAFRYGAMSMYSDRLTLDSMVEHDTKSGETDDIDGNSDAHPKVGFGVKHVIVVTFPPTVVTKDLENLFEPFAVHGVSIRWVNDTTALAIFRNPEFAKEAIRSSKNPLFKLQVLKEENELLAVVDERDLQPPVPRPATSSQAAHRMIMGALRSQGINNKSLPKSSFQDSQKQESERKQRLLTRQKLKDDAWGADG